MLTRHLIVVAQNHGNVPSIYIMEKHPNQLQNPAFSPAYIRELTEIFIEKSIQV